ncbi:MAG: betaine--homocysteine S-methyltransferase [Rhodobacterales bacterium]|nr:betaine--homocysteine S-methyltransferase [Rhodobacterales bacterium]
MSTLLQEMLADKDCLLADGATGTNLFAMGLGHGDAPELWNIDQPDKVRAHYRSFIQAGSDIVLTNSFGGTANRLRLHGAEDRVDEINQAAARLLKEEISAAGRPVVCAGSVGPTGDLFEPLGPLTHAAAEHAFAEQMAALADGGVDAIWIETMSAVAEVEAALEAAARIGLPVVCTLSFDTNGRTMMGVAPVDLVRLVHGRHRPPVAFGGNCGTGAPDLLAGLLSMAGTLKDTDVVVTKANCGIPEFADGEVRYRGTPEMMADYAVLARDAGARIIGGCCGTKPEHVAAMRRALDERPRGETPDLEAITARLGALTGNTADILSGPSGDTPAPRRRRRRPDR